MNTWNRITVTNKWLEAKSTIKNKIIETIGITIKLLQMNRITVFK